MVTTHAEKLYFHTIIRNQHYVDVTNQRFFDEPAMKNLFPTIKEFWNRYKECPSLPQVQELVKMKGLDTEIPNSQLERLWEIDMKDYDADWIKENTECFIECKNLELSAMDLSVYLQTTAVNTDNIKSVITNAKNLIIDKNSIDFTFSEGSDFFNPASHIQPTYNTFSSGFPFIDLISDGGFSAKTLTCLLGAAKVGKSIWLANIAAKAMQAGNNVAIVTMEMAEELYTKRLGANLLNIPIKEYKTAAKDQELIKSRLKDISLNFSTLTIPGQLMIKQFPTSSASSLDIESYLKKVEERRKIKFKVVIIDYINIMKNWRNANSENTYMKIKQIAEDLRAMAISNEWAIITATQVKQGFFDMNDMSIGAAAESSGLVATVDLMMGIIQDPAMYNDKKYKLKVLANRGEGYKNAHKIFDINYDHMRISEDSSLICEEGNNPEFAANQQKKQNYNGQYKK